jgi:hypothetical protein
MDAGAVLGRAVVGFEEEEEGVAEDEEGEEVVADFTLSPRGLASTPVGRFCAAVNHESTGTKTGSFSMTRVSFAFSMTGESFALEGSRFSSVRLLFTLLRFDTSTLFVFVLFSLRIFFTFGIGPASCASRLIGRITPTCFG